MKGEETMELEVDRRLIALVKKFPALYDGEDAQYQDTTWKNNAWRKISDELGMDAKLCRSRWFNMRDIYRRSIIRNNLKRQLGQSVRVYKYARDLAFLNRCYANLLPAQETDPLSEDTDNGGEDDGSASCPEPAAAGRAAVRDAKLERVETPPFLELELPQPGPAHHPVNAFLACIEPTLKALPPYLLNLAKGEIFAVAQKYELRMLTGESRVSTCEADSDHNTNTSRGNII